MASEELASGLEIKEFYASFAWRRLRYLTILKYGRKCMCCGNENEIIHVDHIKPIRRYWHLRLDPENVQVLCELCNHGKGSWDVTDFRCIQFLSPKKLLNIGADDLHCVSGNNNEASMAKILDAAGFDQEFPNISRTALKIETALRDERFYHIIVEKEVKSGARKLLECLKVRNIRELNGKDIQHLYITKLYRRDTEEQFVEMEEYGIKAVKVGSKNDLPLLFEFIDTAIKSECIVWIHFDESDYGTGRNQLFSRIFNRYMNVSDVHFLNYSATNEEAILSKYNDLKYVKTIQLETGEYFKGAKWFLKEGLVYDAAPFWEVSAQKPSEQGQEAIDYWLTTDKSFAILRAAGGKNKKSGVTSNYALLKDNKAFIDFFGALDIKVRFVDKDHPFVWGGSEESDWPGYILHNRKCLIVINQTCTRSTELAFHEHIAFLHDYRPGDTPFNTRYQAYGRVNHYDQVGHRIRVYADIPTFELAARLINYAKYKAKTGMKLSTRVTGGKSGPRHEWQSQFFIEDDIAITTPWELSGAGNPLISFKDGREVPEWYDTRGNKKWNSTFTSSWAAEYDPLFTIIQGRPRSRSEALVCIVNPDFPNEKMKDKSKYKKNWDIFTEWLKKTNQLAEDGRNVFEAIMAGKKVFYHAKPLGLVESGTDVTNKHSLFFNKKWQEAAE